MPTCYISKTEHMPSPNLLHSCKYKPLQELVVFRKSKVLACKQAQRNECKDGLAFVNQLPLLRLHGD